MSAIEVRLAQDDELTAVAGLRWRWFVEGQGATTATLEEFAVGFVSWARTRTSGLE